MWVVSSFSISRSSAIFPIERTSSLLTARAALDCEAPIFFLRSFRRLIYYFEIILPIICFFKGNAALQQKLWEKSECDSIVQSKDYPNLMMALALQNRFIAFHDWFDREIENGAESVEDIASLIFPSL